MIIAIKKWLIFAWCLLLATKANLVCHLMHRWSSWRMTMINGRYVRKRIVCTKCGNVFFWYR
jgi:hypothetical protein